MTRRRTLMVAAVVLAGLILAAGIFWAFTGVLTPRQPTVSVARSRMPIEVTPNIVQPPSGSAMPIENKPNASQPSSDELQAAARVAVKFLDAYVTGCQAATAAWQSNRNALEPIPSEPIVERIRPYATDRLVQDARSGPNSYCFKVPFNYGLLFRDVEVFGVISEGWTDISHGSLSDRELWLLLDSWEGEGGKSAYWLKQTNIKVLLIRQPDGWKVDDVGLEGA